MEISEPKVSFLARRSKVYGHSPRDLMHGFLLVLLDLQLYPAHRYVWWGETIQLMERLGMGAEDLPC